MAYEMPMTDLADLANDLTVSLVSHLTTALIEGHERREPIDPHIFNHECESIVHATLRQHGFVINRRTET